MAVNSVTHSDPAKSGRSLLIIRELPGFADVEGATWLHDEDRVAKEAAIFCRRHFGITIDDVEFARPEDDLEIDVDDLPGECRANPQRLLVDYLFDEQVVPFLLGLGVDLRCERGLPIRSIYHLAPVVESVVRGIAGHQPDPSAASVAGFEAWVSAQVKSYRPSRKRP